MKKFTKRLWEKKNSQKGFTLIELIVVIAILAVLAAMMVPGLLGWIDKAKERQVALNARSVYLATQTLVSEEYAKASPDRTKVIRADILALAEVEPLTTTTFDVYYASDTSTDKGYYQVVGIVYKEDTLSFTIGDITTGTTAITY